MHVEDLIDEEEEELFENSISPSKWLVSNTGSGLAHPVTVSRDIYPPQRMNDSLPTRS